MFRGVRWDRKPYAWSMSPNNLEKQSFSMAYLRRDAQWSGLLLDQHDTGFIMYPQLKTPSTKRRYRVLCAFPVNGTTDRRIGDYACGRSYANLGGESGPCDEQGILTFDDWLAHCKRVGYTDFFEKQCAFNMTVPSAPALFRTVLKASNFIQSEPFGFKNNEIVVRAWNEENAERLPIEAFFYAVDSPDGMRTAWEFQRDFLRASGGEIVPIVAIRFPIGEKGTPERRTFKVFPVKEQVRKRT
nr:PREDICTED: uncharacterized protein LOC109037687 [Bemisia tabaci]